MDEKRGIVTLSYEHGLWFDAVRGWEIKKNNDLLTTTGGLKSCHIKRGLHFTI